jgi:hypothetical protein
MAYIFLVQQLRGAGITEATLAAHLDGTDTNEYLQGIEAEKGRNSLEKALDRWNINFPS